MKMEIDDEGTKTNEDSENNEQMAGDNTQESFEQNSSNTSQQNYDRNGKVFVNIIYLNGVHELAISIEIPILLWHIAFI